MTEGGDSTLLYGPSASTLRQAAFDRASELSGDGIRRVLYIEPNQRVRDEIERAWSEDYPPLTLEVTSFDRFVDQCHEQLFGVTETLGRQERLRLIESALIDLDEEGVLDGAPALLQEFSQYFADVEAAGIETATELERALQAVDVPGRIRAPTVAAYRRFTDLRSEHTTDLTQPRSRRLAAVADAETPLQSCFPSLDVVVVADRRSFPSVELALFERLAEEFHFLATLPAIHDTPDGIGADRAIRDTVETYRSLGCDPTFVSPSAHDEALHSLAKELYVHSESDAPVSTDSVDWRTAPTTEREVRHVARCIRRQLSQGVSPEDIGVVVPRVISYREQFADVFQSYEIPYVSYANKILQQTHVGDAVLRLLELCHPDPDADTLVGLLDNPAVSLDPVDPAAVADLNRRLPTPDCSRLVDQLPAADGACRLEQFLTECQSARAQPAADAVVTIREQIDELGLESTITSWADGDGRTSVQLEQRTLAEVDRVLDSIVEFADTGLVSDPIERLERALGDVRAPAPRQEATGRVEVMGLLDARGKSFDHVYLVGATADALPATARDPLFFDELEEALPALQTREAAVVDSDPQHEARYQFATLMTSANAVHASTPDATIDDESVLPSPVIDEVVRLTGIEPAPPDDDHGTVEDVQRSLARYETTDELLDAVATCESDGVLRPALSRRLEAGTRCAHNRGMRAITEHDGQLHPDTVEDVFSAYDLSTFSPSRLRGYAKCGFAYYLSRGFDWSAPDDITTEPDNLDLGGFIHDTLERFFSGLQERPGDPVDLGEYELPELEERLLESAEAAEAELELSYDSPFFTTWKSRLLAGLATPSANDYFDPTTTGQPAPELGGGGRDRGFLLRVLEAEYGREGELRPTWFEEPVGFDEGGEPFELPLPDGTTVEISGIIDRIDAAVESRPVEATVLDYKTGRTNLQRTIEGMEFQLPLYAIAAQAGIEGETATPREDILVDAHFYDLDVPTGVSLKGPLSERLGDGAADPAYQSFLADVTPERVQEITRAVRDGAFHPSVLGAREAGCRYCDYRDVCDVRHYARHQVVDHIDQAEQEAYVADRGRDVDVTSRLQEAEDT